MSEVDGSLNSSQTNNDKTSLASVSLQPLFFLLSCWVCLHQICEQALLLILQLPEYNQALLRGREIRGRLTLLHLKETELDQEHYGRALRLPNTTHPDVVRTHSHTLGDIGCNVHLTRWPSLIFFQPVGDESQARVVEQVGHKPGD